MDGGKFWAVDTVKYAIKGDLARRVARNSVARADSAAAALRSSASAARPAFADPAGAPLQPVEGAVPAPPAEPAPAPETPDRAPVSP